MVVGYSCVHAIFKAAGGPAAPLDDSFIHLNFARRLAEGHFFSFSPGDGYSSGATSPLWVLLLVPFYRLGLHGSSLLWGAWFWGLLAHAATAVEASRIARRLAGRAVGAAVGMMCVLFSAFAWFAWSGMETMVLAWVLLRTARIAASYCEPERGRAPPSARQLIVLAILAPLVRPEGALASLIAAVALVVYPRGPRVRRLLAFAPLLGPLVVPLVNLAFTGHGSASTTQVKWSFVNPYYDISAAMGLTFSNLETLLKSTLDGGYFPDGSTIPIVLGLVAVPIAGVRRRARWHAVFVLMVALGGLIPCTYLTFLWNRTRYVWPFAGAWFVLLGCVARELGDLVRLLRPRLVYVTPLLAGAYAGALGLRLPGTVRDLAKSAHAIQRQQVALGKWAAERLPADAIIGVNDTGAIAYFSGRRTFDVVGLTTEGEARYWVAGAGSRFEHYEKLPRERLPTHFIVYPAWMACAPVLGKKLHEATVRDQSILGGVTMVVHEARWDLLGSGALPAAPPPDLTLADELDVADLESEAAHRFDKTGSNDPWDQTRGEPAGSGKRVIADGGRVGRTVDRFWMKVPSSNTLRLVMRVLPEAPGDLVVTVDGQQAGSVPLAGAKEWVEPSLPLPENLGGRAVEVTVHAKARPGAKALRFGSYHYWLYAEEESVPAGNEQ